ncbi:MAG: PspC domain-containing protein [Anaerolineaceae bacterium]|nr:PspC domain-containing protein [Anaerolineaceae bacterium]
MANRLFRSESDRVLGGVCAGFGNFLGIDPIFIRIFFIVWTVLGEYSVLVYFLLWVIVPSGSSVDADGVFQVNDLGARFNQMGREIGEIARQPNSELVIFTGVGLIAWGSYYLFRRLVPYLDLWAYSQYLWPALLIIAGVFVIIRAKRNN